MDNLALKIIALTTLDSNGEQAFTSVELIENKQKQPFWEEKISTVSVADSISCYWRSR